MYGLPKIVGGEEINSNKDSDVSSRNPLTMTMMLI
jgi:hypothetical protein